MEIAVYVLFLLCLLRIIISHFAPTMARDSFTHLVIYLDVVGMDALLIKHSGGLLKRDFSSGDFNV